MARYRSASDPITQPWERPDDDPWYAGRHWITDGSRVARVNTDRLRALKVCDQAVDNAASQLDRLRQGHLRQFVLLGHAS